MHQQAVTVRRVGMSMELFKLLKRINVFLIEMKIKIKCMPEEKFYELLQDMSLNNAQRLYLCYFRFM